MAITNPGISKNGVRILSIVRAFIVYGVAIMMIHNATRGNATLPLVIYIALAAIISFLICKKDIKAAESKSNKFKKSLPFRFYGESFGDFQHVFHYNKNLDEEIESTIKSDLIQKTSANDAEIVSITDVDKGISNPETRSFVKVDSAKTERGTNITLLFKSSCVGQVQSIRWWVLVGGFIDYNKFFNFVAYSPITLIFWLIPYIKKDFDVQGKIKTIYSSSYNDFDIATNVRCLHDTVFNAMVKVLEKHEIDTSDIKVQRAQVMNISISGGKVNMGNVVQGAMNKIASTIRRS